MFLSKIFGIFKKRKDNQQDTNAGSASGVGAVVPPAAGVIGVAADINPPAQQQNDGQTASPTPEPPQLAQAPQDPFATSTTKTPDVPVSPPSPSDSFTTPAPNDLTTPDIPLAGDEASQPPLDNSTPPTTDGLGDSLNNQAPTPDITPPADTTTADNIAPPAGDSSTPASSPTDENQDIAV